jgi:hypothetical protein
MTTTPFIDCTTLEGQRRIRGYIQSWLERLDYSGRLERTWPPEELGCCIWDRVEREFSAVWRGPIVENRGLSRVIAITMVEDYFAAYSARRPTRYSVSGFLPDVCFRRCVLDFVNDLEEYEPGCLDGGAEAMAALFWDSVRETPERWGCRPEHGPFIDDELIGRSVVLEVIREHLELRTLVAAVECRELV